MEYKPLLKWEPYANVKSQHKENIKKDNDKMLSLIKEMRDNNFNNYANKLEKINSDKSNSLIEYNISRTKLKEEYSFFGYLSKRMFLYEMGSSLFSLIPTVLLIVLICSPIIIKKLKNFLIVGVLGILYVSFFWIFHNIFAMYDFSNWVYSMSYIICSIISTILTLLLILYFNYRETKKKKIEEGLEKLLSNGEELLDLIK